MLRYLLDTNICIYVIKRQWPPHRRPRPQWGPDPGKQQPARVRASPRTAAGELGL